MKIEVSQEQIDNQLNGAAEWVDAGGSSAPGASYEQGVEAAIRWMLGETTDLPIQVWPDREGE